MNALQALVSFARDRGACREARVWLATQSDPRAAWETCERPDWMIWYARRRDVDPKVFVRIACDCARTVLWLVPEGENRPRLAIEVAERRMRGEATIDEVRDAAYAAEDAAADAAYVVDAAADATYAAAYAAVYTAAAAAAADATYAAAYAAVYTAAAAAYAAYVVDAAADAADAYAGTREQANIQMCQIIRTHLRYEDVAL